PEDASHFYGVIF
ncbi:hypothetical protein EC881467_0142, partial [Escherichia coli 88.1467]